MKRLVIMAFSYDTVCFPSSPPYRIVTAAGSCSVTSGGAQRASIVGCLTTWLAERGVAVDDVEVADGDDCFAMIIRANMETEQSVAALRDSARAYGETLGVSVRVQREELFLAMHRI